MGLTAHDMSDMGRLAQLAMNPQSGATREEIYLAVASLYRIQGTGLNERERELMREILRRLARDVEMTIRIALTPSGLGWLVRTARRCPASRRGCAGCGVRSGCPGPG